MTENQIDSKTEELIEDQINIVSDDRLVKRIDKDHIEIDGATYEIVVDYQEAVDLEKIEARYTEFFEKFHYIVGDMSKDQLRLKGFYEDDQQNIPIDLKISYVEDYLAEYCSFGCSYFILKRLDKIKNFQPYKEPSKSNNSRGSRRKSQRQRSNKSSGRKDNHRQNNKRSKKSSKSSVKKQEFKPKNDKGSKKHKSKTVKNKKGQAKFTIHKKG